MEQLSCRLCGAPLGADAIDRRLAIVSCKHCNSIFDLTRTSTSTSPAAPGEVATRPRPGVRERGAVPLPERFIVERRGGRFEVSWRWFRPLEHLFLLFFAIAWNSFLLVWYGIAFGVFRSGQAAGTASFLMVVFPIGHVAVGLGVGYTALTGLLNRTKISVDTSGDLTVRHSPLPWWPSPTLQVRDIEQLYCTSKTTTNKGSSTTRYALHAIKRDHSKVKLLDRLDTLEQALWLEQEIESTLGIRDRRVEGEVVE